MKRLALIVGIVASLCIAQLVTAAPYPLQQYGGGTGTNATSSAGETLISTGSTTYTPAFLMCSGGCTVTSASGSITINAASTTAITSNAGNWACTWQGNGPATFYAASNPNSYISGNQVITIAATGDATGTASGATSITHSLTVTGLQGKALPSLASGTLYYYSGAWHLGNAVDANGNQYVTSTSAGSGISTSSAVTAFDFPYWANAAGGLSGTSTVYVQSSTGYIGINDANPLRGLEVAGSSTATTTTTIAPDIGILNTNSSTNSNYSGLSFLTTDASGSEILAAKVIGTAVSHIASAVSGSLGFITRNAGALQTDLTITPSGGANFLGPINNSSTLVTGSTTIIGNATTTALSITSLAGASGCLNVSASGQVTTSTCSAGTGPAGSVGNLQYNAGSGSFGALGESSENGNGGIVLAATGANTSPFDVTYTGATTGSTILTNFTGTASLNQQEANTFNATLNSADGGNTATFSNIYNTMTLNMSASSSLTHAAMDVERITDTDSSASTSQGGGALSIAENFYGDYTKTGNSTTSQAIYSHDAGAIISGGNVTNVVGNDIAAPSVSGGGFVQNGYGDFLYGPSTANASMTYFSALQAGQNGFGETCGNLGGTYSNGNLYLDQCNSENTSGFASPVVIGFAPDVPSTAPMTNSSPNMLTIGDNFINDVTSTLTAKAISINMESGGGSAGTMGGLEGVDATVDNETGNATTTQITAFNATAKNGQTGSTGNAYLYKGQFAGSVYGTIGNLYGLYLNNLKPGSGTGSVTNLYGVAVADANARNYFAGNVGIATTTVSNPLTVQGNVVQAGGTVSLASTTISGNATATTLSVTGATSLASVTVSGNATTAGIVNSSTIQTNVIYEPFATSTASASATVINWALSNKQWLLLTTSTAISFSNVQNGASYSLWLIQTSTAYTVTWPSSGAGRVLWPGAAAPILTTTINDMDEMSFQCLVPSQTSTLSCYGAYGSGNWAQ